MHGCSVALIVHQRDDAAHASDVCRVQIDIPAFEQVAEVVQDRIVTAGD